ncbi:MAG: class I SAM-dependent rRNA methyltransferase [Gammaproteobacteria bacterium]|nr:class I SAM-dependent rRNA methyltransferase [Gammaproteobacteria bacterium]NDB15598.1 class I SAM-dependent rRNA methyltransferase [Gammaproteobacteria bacterium]NDF85676.1 class I SAM-dependent rRNA methyltransferase [Gammaproteobacteria bacterium]
MPELRLRRGEDRRLRAGHLWVFSNEIDVAATPLASFEPGAQVRVLSDRGQSLGVAYLNPATLIAARILARDADGPLGRKWLAGRLRQALALRESCSQSAHYRWVFGESDGLPGLVLDRYGDIVVGQIATLGMERLQSEIEAAIREVLDPAVLLWKNDSGARALEGLGERVQLAWGELPEQVSVREVLPAGPTLNFAVDLAGGQKTGWFFDQTFNRSLLPRFLRAGARVLDVCSYAGGWATTAAAAGAREVGCVDSSASALALAARNVGANTPLTAVLHRGDAFEVLAALAETGERYDAVIVDPPAFIKRRKEIPQGQAAYRKLNQLALRVLEPGGLLVSCSCSHHLASEDLLAAIQGAARHVDRFVQVLYEGGQSPDHPRHPAIPETRYLKAFFCRVSRG